MIVGRIITPWIVRGAAALLAGLLLSLGVSRCQLSRSTEAQGVLHQQLVQCREDLGHETAQLNALADELDRISAALGTEQAAYRAATARADELDRQRAHQAAAEQRARADIYADTAACSEWAGAPVCAELAERMIERRRWLQAAWGQADG